MMVMMMMMMMMRVMMRVIMLRTVMLRMKILRMTMLRMMRCRMMMLRRKGMMMLSTRRPKPSSVRTGPSRCLATVTGTATSYGFAPTPWPHQPAAGNAGRAGVPIHAVRRGGRREFTGADIFVQPTWREVKPYLQLESYRQGTPHSM